MRISTIFRTRNFTQVLQCLPIALVAFIPCHAHAGEVAPSSPLVSIEGRVQTLASSGVRMGFPGSTVRLVCSGAELRLHGIASTETVWFDVSIDGGDFRPFRFPKGEHTVPLCDQSGDGQHQVVLVRRTESWQGTFDLLGFSTEGRLSAPAPLSDRRLMFIGDSITCGAGAVAELPEGADATFASNARLAFGTVLARRLGAQVHLVSYGGKGLVRDWQGMRSEVSAPQFYERAVPDDRGARWDHKVWIPDAIAVCLGTNDFNGGLPDEQDWVAAYVALVHKLRRDAPAAHIFLLESPMHGDHPASLERMALRRYLARTIEELADERVHTVPLAFRPGSAINTHPSAADHEAIAGELEPLYRRALGW